MKKELWFALVLLGIAILPAPAQQAADLKAAAYESYQAKRFDEAARNFQAYLEKNPDDAMAQIDYASLLSELGRHQDSANLLETIRKKTPENETVAFKLAVEYAALKRHAEADKLFAELEKSKNSALALAAAEASKRSKEDQAREGKLSEEQRIYALANQFKYQEVVDAINALEQKGPLSFAMQMQRLYALHSLSQYATALKGADQLAATHPDESDLALLRAELLVQLGRRPEAETIWRRLGRQFVGTPAAVEAERHLSGVPAAPPEERIYELARQRKHRAVIAAIDELEKKGPLSVPMQMQRLYAYQALGENKAALEQLDKIAGTHSNSTDLAFFRSDLLLQQHRWQEASKILKQLKNESGEISTVREAERRLEAIPPIANLDKHFWGEAYTSGDYLGRFGTVVGSGFIREGAFIPHARWLQPYAEMRFGVDTRSGVSGERTIVTDNHVGLYGGIRAQPLPAEYLFVYAQVGADTDLLERRHHGDFAYDSQAGIYGFKSWGPGRIMFRSPPGWQAPPDRPDSFAPRTRWRDKNLGDLFFWRGDWFADAGADFSYYHRYSSWIGYGQAHEGFRVFQVGPTLGFDAYVVENLSWDVRGNYFDNLFEIGPGARLLWLPHRGWEVVLRTEWLNGFYLGRGRDAFAVAPRSQYDEVRVGLSVGARW